MYMRVLCLYSDRRAATVIGVVTVLSVLTHIAISIGNIVYMYWFFFSKQKTAYEMRISDWSSDVCSSDLLERRPGETPLDAGVASICLAVFPGHHAHDLVSFHLGFECTTHTAVGTGGQYGVFGLAHFYDRFLGKRRCRAGLYTGPARYAVAFKKGIVLAGHDARVEPHAVDRQGERALGFVAGAYAAAAHDATGRIVGEIGIGFVFGVVEMIGAIGAVAHLAQPDHAGHVLEFAIAVGGAGHEIERVIRYVQFHDVAAHFL